MPGSERVWTDEELKRLEDPDFWDWERPIERRTNPAAGAVLAIRFSREEARRLFAASEAQGVSVIQYVHDAALNATECSPD
jgi:hypothetical protein